VPVHFSDIELLRQLDAVLGKTFTPEETEIFLKGLPWLRRRAWYWWYKRVKRHFETWAADAKVGKTLEEQRKLERGLGMEHGWEAVRYAGRSSWWEWDGGSAIFFWNWPAEFQFEAQMGLPPFWKGPPPTNRRPQRPPRDPDNLERVRNKANKFRKRGYITAGQVASLINMFDVPKGLDDIRLVFDGTRSGLNAALFAPWFHLPTSDDMFGSLLAKYWCMDHDFGEMFYNFWLSDEVQAYLGVDFTRIFPEEVKGNLRTLWERWVRAVMGMTPSPYQGTRGVAQMKRELYRDRLNPDNPYHWAEVVCNMPGTKDYDPGKPWVFKVRFDGELACEVYIFIDDCRICAPTARLAWEAGSRLAKLITKYGLQVALRKFRPPSQKPSAGSGVVVVVTGEDVYVKVSDERWTKTKERIGWIREQVSKGITNEDGFVTIPFKELEKIWVSWFT
jgi:hypothetical protein